MIAVNLAPISEWSKAVTQFSPEMRILIGCARSSLTEEDQAELEDALHRVRDWDLLLRRVRLHGLGSLITGHLERAAEGDQLVPQNVLDTLRERRQASTRNSLQLSAELIQLLDLFKAHEICAIPIKGPALAVDAFGDTSAREYGDLDILLPKSQVFLARDLMMQQGYQCIVEYRKAIEKQLLRYRAELGLQRDGMLVELQWQITPRYFAIPIDVTRMAGRTREIEFNQAAIPALSVEDQLLMLCIHGGKHLWGRLMFLADVHQWILKNPGLDWQALEAEARRVRAHRFLLVGLGLASQIMGTNVPDRIMRQIDQDKACCALLEKEIDYLNNEYEFTLTQQHQLSLRYRERLIDKVRYLVRIATDPSELEWAWVKLPGPLTFLYRVVRMVRAVLKIFHLA